MSTEPLLKVTDLRVDFDVSSGFVMPWRKPTLLTAVRDISLELYAGETLGIVGESGCGKSTLARAIIGLIPASSGSVLWRGQELLGASKPLLRELRPEIQMVFQDPLACLNPRMTIGEIIADPVKTLRPEIDVDTRKNMVRETMDAVGLLANTINRYPHEFSGGQCQRIGIARAIILKPKLLICDEPVSALDVSIQAQVINLLEDLKQEMGLSLLFIAHNLSVVKHISDRVTVMYLGAKAEEASKKDLFSEPKHPYTRALLSAVPVPDPRLERDKKIEILEGELPSPIFPPPGCVFNTRCPRATDRCVQEVPKPLVSPGQHTVACHNPF